MNLKGTFVLKCKWCGQVIKATGCIIEAEDEEKFLRGVQDFPITMADVPSNGFDIFSAMVSRDIIKDKKVMTHFCNEEKTQAGILEFVGATVESWEKENE